MRHVVETADGRERTGGFEPETAYNGTHEENFYRTPASLFVNTDTVNPSAADSINGQCRKCLQKHHIVYR
ncbi:hypothetical protein DPMN_032755 [Dreissena polymorpha]|uniref:Uncharacterized protein n=1 Tax=Dreissena polymorpha TaxID=45954 RepID=A0A9D4M4S9_DREPO|nr:hypothetical protein DPMN_032755 [Dreissena polymorpha]